MLGNSLILVRRAATWGWLIIVAMSWAVMPLQSAAHDAKGQSGSVCPGFVVLTNGYAVLSGDAMQVAKGHGHGGSQIGKMADKGHGHGGSQIGKMVDKGHGHGGSQIGKMVDKGHGHGGSQIGKMVDKGHGHGGSQIGKMVDKGHGHGGSQIGKMVDKGRAAVQHKHLMGHRHGEAIVAGKDGLCVPIGSPEDTAWMALSRDDSLHVMASSLRGALAHNSRANEGFGITIVRSGEKRLESGDVQLFVRMPHHDHRMPGGHGPANDPDVKGFALMPDDQGRYRVNTVDFSMPGPWLLEVLVKHGDETLKAYFAPKVGEE